MNWIARCLWLLTMTTLWLMLHTDSVEGKSVHLRMRKHSRTGARMTSSSSSSSLPHRRSQKRLKRARIAAIKQDILAKLGLDHIPDVSRINVTQEDVRRALRLYEQSVGNDRDQSHVLFDDEEFLAKQFHQFSVADCLGDDDCFFRYNPDGYHLRFPVKLSEPLDVRRETRVYSASLRLYKHETRPENIRDSLNIDRTVRVSIYQVIQRSTSNSTLRRLIDSKMVSVDSVGWETFDVTAAVAQWKHEQSSNHGLLIICDSQPLAEVMDFADQQFLSFHDNTHNLRNNFPLLNVYTQDEFIIRRRKRSLTSYDCTKGDGETRCCRYPLEIRFKEIGWDWVYAPDSFQAYFCEGSCPHSYKMAHSFAAIQSKMHIINPAAAPTPCCSASKLAPLDLAHYDDNGQIKVTKYDDLIVQECKCT